MTYRAAVAGASGYAGGELLRLLLGHPASRSARSPRMPTRASALGAHQPHLLPLADRMLDETTAAALAGHDAVFLALPHGQSHELAAQLPADIVVIDCGADHRLTDPGGVAAVLRRRAPGQLAVRTARAARRPARRWPGPGGSPCPAATRPPRRWRMAPALAAGLVEPDVVVVAASGTSGAGRSLKTNLLGSEVMGSASAYGVGGVHRHTPEIVQNLSGRSGVPVRVSFTPVLVPMSRGILATVSAPAIGDVDLAAVRNVYEKAYGDRALRASAARGAMAGHLRDARRQHRAAAGRGGPRRPAGWWSSPRSTTSPRAPRAAPCSA